jgi:hypothetical protein
VVILYEGINTNVEFLMGFWEHLVCFFCGKGWNLSFGREARENNFTSFDAK